jgi:hypothetical protein
MPILGTLPYLENPRDVKKLTQAAANLDLERLFQPLKINKIKES